MDTTEQLEVSEKFWMASLPTQNGSTAGFTERLSALLVIYCTTRQEYRRVDNCWRRYMEKSEFKRKKRQWTTLMIIDSQAI